MGQGALDAQELEIKLTLHLANRFPLAVLGCYSRRDASNGRVQTPGEYLLYDTPDNQLNGRASLCVYGRLGAEPYKP